MTPSDRLKACPFCPSTDMTIYSSHVAPKPYSVECNVCEATSGCYESKQEAIDAWNTRIPDPVVAKLVHKCRVMVAYIEEQYAVTTGLGSRLDDIENCLSRLESETKGGQDG